MQNGTIGAVVEAMTKFASDTKDDRLSVNVARVAQRLAHVGHPFEKPLTRSERQIIRPFLEKVRAAA